MSSTGADTDTEPKLSVESLRAEFAESDTDPEIPIPIPEAPGTSLMPPAVLGRIYVPSAVVLAEQDPGPCGRDIMRSFERTTGDRPNPATIYPLLEELRDQGMLTQVPKVRTKRQVVADAETLDAHLAGYEQRLQWLLAICTTARDALDVEDSD